MSILAHIIIIVLILATLAMTIVIYNEMNNKPKFSFPNFSSKILKAPSCEECNSLTNENAKRMCLEGCQLDTCYKECSGKKSRPECILECVTNGNYNGYNNNKN
jgi:hypothetical protein